MLPKSSSPSHSLQNLNSDVLSSIEDFLEVKSILSLTETSLYWHNRWKWRWKWLFFYRWGKMKEKTLDAPKWLSQLFMADFWHNIEAAFLGLSSVSGNIDDESEISLFESLFIIFQPKFLQTVGRQMKPLLRSLSVTSLNYWKYVCVLSDHGSRSDVITCHECKQLDIKTALHKKYEKLIPNISHISPCSCPFTYHCSCFESVLNDAVIGKKALSLDNPNHLAFLSQRPLTLALSCHVCGDAYNIGVRLPLTVVELSQLTLNDPFAMSRIGKCLFIWIALVCLSSIISPVSVIFDIWLLEQVVLLDIFFSDRFLCTVRHLWRGPIFVFYCQLYLYFVMACAFICIAYSPITAKFVHIPVIIMPLAALNWIIYVIIGSIVTIIWWKTNYRIVTVLDRSSTGNDNSHPIFLFQVN